MSTGNVLGDPTRLAAVARVLPVARGGQEALDRLAELAATVLDTPIGVVNLIDTEQHLVGQVGLGEPFATSRQASIDTGFYPSAFFVDKPLYIENVAEEPAFIHHPGHVTLGFIAYAGAPLRDANGQVLGTLCVMDTRPRRWSRAARHAPEALATAVVHEMKLYQDIREWERRALGPPGSPRHRAATTSDHRTGGRRWRTRHHPAPEGRKAELGWQR